MNVSTRKVDTGVTSGRHGVTDDVYDLHAGNDQKSFPVDGFLSQETMCGNASPINPS